MNQKKGMGPVRWIVLIAAVAVFCVSGYRLYTILSGYKAASDEYSSLADSFTSEAEEENREGDHRDADTASALAVNAPEFQEASAGETAVSSGNLSAADASPLAESGSLAESGTLAEVGALTGNGTPAGSGGERNPSGTKAEDEKRKEDVKPKEEVKHVTYKNPETREEEVYLVEDAAPPLKVNWKKLKDINPDIVGWVTVDGLDNISYPVLRGKDNDTYLHQTFRKQYLYAGSIFEDANNAADFADPNTIVYGHNMKDGSMFGKLKELSDQTKYDENPYFWILTPEGNYRYHIFSIFTASVDSDTYVLFSQNGPEFLEWEKEMQKLSDVKNDVELMKSDKAVVLSTCTSDSSRRCVVIGKCVSSDRPVRKHATELTVVGK